MVTLEWQDTCSRCGCDLPLDAPVHQRYCGKRCRDEAHAETVVQTRDAFNAVRRARRREAKLGRPPCLECGKPIAPEAPAGKRYCCENCGNRAYTRRRSALWREERLSERARLREARRADRKGAGQCLNPAAPAGGK
jgi:hypothetical protein